MKNVALIAFGFGLLVLQAAMGTLVSIHPFAPNLLLPVAIYLGVSPDVNIARGAAIAFVLGYLLDSFCGSPIGLWTFVLVATFMVARGAGLRLFLRGPLFQIVLTFLVGVLAAGTILALRAIFEKPAPFPHDELHQIVASLLIPALVTALASPLVFAGVRRVEQWTTRRGDEGALAA